MKRQIGLNIKSIRKKVKITQEILAERCNLSVEAISNIERGINYPHFETLVQIANILGCRLSDILDENICVSNNSKRIQEENILISRIKKLSDEKVSMLIKIVEAIK